MHKTSLAPILLVPCLLLALAGCGGPAPAALRPSVRIVAPTNGLKEEVGRGTVTVRLAISNFALVFSATGDKAGTGQVWLYENGKFLGQMATTSLPISLQPGINTLEAVLVTNGKEVASSTPVVVSITSPPVNPVITATPGPTSYPNSQMITFAESSHACLPSGRGVSSSAAGSESVSIRLFCLPAPYEAYQDLGPPFVLDASGNLWFTVGTAQNGPVGIGKIAPSGTISIFPNGLPVGDYPESLVPGSGGDKLTPAFPISLPAGESPGGLVSGSGGDKWFTVETTTNTGTWNVNVVGIGQITRSGAISIFSKGLPMGVGPSGQPSGGISGGLVLGAGGDMWFATCLHTQPQLRENCTGSMGIGKITPAGAISVFTKGLSAHVAPDDLVLGPDGDIWFKVQTDQPAIGKITPSGAITLYSNGLPVGAALSSLTPGPDGSLWFEALTPGPDGSLAIGQITPSGTIKLFHRGLPSGPAGSAELVAGPGASLWFIYGDGWTDSINGLVPTTWYDDASWAPGLAYPVIGQVTVSAR